MFRLIIILIGGVLLLIWKSVNGLNNPAHTCTDLSRFNQSALKFGHYLNVGYFYNYNGLGIMQCIRRCMEQSLCVSVSYFTEFMQCTLNERQSENPTDFTSYPAAIYTDMTYWPVVMAGNCAYHSCKDNAVCKETASGYICVVIMCGLPPIYANADYFYHTSVTKYNIGFNLTSKHECHSGYFAAGSVICESTGNWTEFKCVKKVRSCDDLVTCNSIYGSVSSGEFWLYSDAVQSSIKVHCTSENPTTVFKSYITLLQPNYLHLKSLQPVGTCSSNTDPRIYGSVTYEKVAINVANLQLNTNDVLGNSSYGGDLPRYGLIYDCSDKLYCQMFNKSELRIDTKGTGLAVDPSTNWITGTFINNFDIVMIEENRTFDVNCVGSCDSCSSNSDYIDMVLDDDFRPDDQSATFPDCV